MWFLQTAGLAPPDWNLFRSDPRRASSKSGAFACKSGCITVSSLTRVTLPELSICVVKSPQTGLPASSKLHPHRGSTPTQRSLDSAPLSVWTWPSVVRGHPDGPVYWLPGFRCQRHTGQLCSNPLVFTVHSKKIQKYPSDNLRRKPSALITRGTNHNHCLWIKKKKKRSPEQISDSSTALIQLVCRMKSPISVSTNNNFIAIWNLQWNGRL